jgi:hypothetical protein
MSCSPHSNDPSRDRRAETDQRSLPGSLAAVALALFAVDLLLRLGSGHWLIDLDGIAALALMVGVVELAIRARVENAPRIAAEYDNRYRGVVPVPPHRVTDGGTGLAPPPSRPGVPRASARAPSIDGGTFPEQGWG